MRKVLGISFVAVLTVVPMMAHATDITPIESVTGTALTTQAYVKGAYNDLAGYINTKADKTTVSGLADKVTALESTAGGLDGTYATKEGVASTVQGVEIEVTDGKDVSSTVTGDISTTSGSIVVANSWTDAESTTTVNFLTGANKGDLGVDTQLSGSITAAVKDDTVVYPE